MLSLDYIYSADPGLIIGFHGCDEDVRDKVVTGKIPLKPSRNEWDWLGEGRYFWQNNYRRAWDYANNPPPGVKIKNPSVLGAVFNLGHCLDLVDKQGIDLVKYSHETLWRSAEVEGKILPRNTNSKEVSHSNDKIIRRLDCAVINNIHREMEKICEPPFDTVRSVFFEGDPIYEGAGFLDKTHVQICIRNPNMIKGFFIPRRSMAWT